MVATSFDIDLNLTLSDDTSVMEVQSSFYDDDDEEDERLFQNEVDDRTIRDLSRIIKENKKLKEKLMIVCDKYNSLQTQHNKIMQEKEVLEVINPKKRKFDEAVQQSSWKRPDEELFKSSGIRIVYVPTDPSDKSLVVKDEYQWRKYGQKVTRDNPSPRAYYKCSFAPTCLVKKKVQRSVDDVGIVVATYEGEHNHRSRKQEATYALANQHEISTSERRSNSPKPMPNFDEVLVKQMATYLIKDHNFTLDLAAAISSKVLELDLFKVC